MSHQHILLDCCWKCLKSNSVFGNREYLEQNMAGSANTSPERRLWITVLCLPSVAPRIAVGLCLITCICALWYSSLCLKPGEMPLGEGVGWTRLKNSVCLLCFTLPYLEDTPCLDYRLVSQEKGVSLLKNLFQTFVGDWAKDTKVNYEFAQGPGREHDSIAFVQRRWFFFIPL